jgi:hypothetical protein
MNSFKDQIQSLTKDYLDKRWTVKGISSLAIAIELQGTRSGLKFCFLRYITKENRKWLEWYNRCRHTQLSLRRVVRSLRR